MADSNSSDNAGLGVIVGVLAVVVVLLLAGGFGPRFFRHGPPHPIAPITRLPGGGGPPVPPTPTN